MRRTKEDALATRDAILDAAETVFHRQGVARSTLANIASEAKVTRGAIYWHFSGKAEIVRAMSERVTAPEEEFFVQQVEIGAGRELNNLKSLMLEMLRRFQGNEHAQRVHEILMFRCEYVGEMSEALEGRRSKQDNFAKAVAEALNRAKEGGELGVGWAAPVAAAVLRCTVLGLISDWIRFERSFDLLDVGSALLESVFASFSMSRDPPKAPDGDGPLVASA